MDQTIKDNRGAAIGRMRDSGDLIIMMDSHGALVGKYKKSSDETFDKRGAKVGKGNLLAMLLNKN